ncbi:hypothetical protein BDD12DRAFT_942900 [Trichophaea hybrida]|nr:hypothetical protein BDD12DRAFT_942900 [Trichophaea hybrida]
MDGVKGLLFKVRWKGYDASYDTWEPRKNLGGCELVLKAWERKQAKTNGKKRSGSISNREKHSKKVKGESSSDESLKEKIKDALTLTDIIAGVKGPVPTVTYNTQTHFGGNSGGSGSAKRTARPQKTSSYVEKPTLPEVLAHLDYQAFVKKLKALKGPEVQLVNEIDTTPSPPTDFEFIESLRLSDEVPSFDPDFAFGCECPESGCIDEEECGCLNDFAVRKFAYNKHGRVIRDGEVAIVECNDKCSCGPDCINRVVQNGRKVKLQIFKTENKGWGIRCPERLKEGTFIDLYLGEVIGPKEASRRAEAANKLGLSYLFDLDKFSLQDDMQDELSIGMEEPDHDNHYTIDGRDCGGVTRFINHSCDPNLETYAVASDRRDGKVYDLAIFTCRDIPAYEEMCFSYTMNFCPL